MPRSANCRRMRSSFGACGRGALCSCSSPRATVNYRSSFCICCATWTPSAGCGSRQRFAVLEEARLRLTHADLVRKHQGVNMPEHLGELLLEEARVDGIGIAAEQEPVARLEPRDQVADFRVGPEDVGTSFGQKI